MTPRVKAFNLDKNLVVSINRPVANGKGTVGRALANKLKLTYFQSSLVYRNLALCCINNKIAPTDIEAVVKLPQTPRYKESDKLSEEKVGYSISNFYYPSSKEQFKYIFSKINRAPPESLWKGEILVR